METALPHVVLLSLSHADALRARLHGLGFRATAYDPSACMLFGTMPRSLAPVVRAMDGVLGVLEDTEPLTEEISAARDIWT